MAKSSSEFAMIDTLYFPKEIFARQIQSGPREQRISFPPFIADRLKLIIVVLEEWCHELKNINWQGWKLRYITYYASTNVLTLNIYWMPYPLDKDQRGIKCQFSGTQATEVLLSIWNIKWNWTFGGNYECDHVLNTSWFFGQTRYVGITRVTSLPIFQIILMNCRQYFFKGHRGGIIKACTLSFARTVLDFLELMCNLTYTLRAFKKKNQP